MERRGEASASQRDPWAARRVRVCIVAPSLDFLGGQAIQAQRLLAAFADNERVQATFLAVNPRLPGPLRALQRIKYVRTIVTGIAYVASLVSRVKDYDVLHVFSASYWSFVLAPVPALLVARLYGRPALLNYRSGEAPDHLAHWRTARWGVRQATRVVVPSAYLVGVFGEYGVTAQSIPNFVDVSRIPFRERSPLRPRFLSNRNFEALYNVSCTLRAFAAIQARVPEATLVVAGDGPQRRALEALAVSLGLRAVTFAGKVAPERMPELYAAADIYLNSPNLDNMPTSIIEAFAAGLAVVTTDAGGIPFIVRHGDNGRMVARDDAAAMAAEACALLDDPQGALAMTRRARAECEARYVWPAVRAQWEALYRDVAFGAAPRDPERRRGRLRGRSLAELTDRALQACRAAAERAGFSSDMGAATPAAGEAELRDSDGRPYADAAAALGAFRAQASSRFLAGTADIAATVAAIRTADPGAAARTLELATAAAAGRHRLLGYDALDYGTPPDWHLDPVHGRRAPLVHWSRVPYLDEEVVGDHKVTWELNRHQWLVHLAKAYHFSGEERWAEEAFAHLDAWIEANPCKLGINWASSLEIALRGIAWLWVLYLLRDARALTPARFVRMARVLAVGARQVERHLSTWSSPNTHLTGEALGLLYLGCALPGLNGAARWRDLGLAILAQYMPQHVRPDGTYVEQSTHYARYTVDFLLHAVALGRRSDVAIPPPVNEALERGASFLRHAARPDGTIPLIGDDDGGRVMFLDPAAADDVRPTLAVAAAITCDPTLAYPSATPSEELAWLLGPFALLAATNAAAGHPAGGSRFFPGGGLAVLRDGWERDASVAVFDCGAHGMGNGGHAHADLGSIDLTLRGRCVVVDPGTWSYLMGNGARDSFRGAAAHAVATVDGEGSAEPAQAFSWSRAPNVTARFVALADECDIVAFTHDGFAHLSDPVAHRRTLVRLRGNYWLVIDAFRAARRHDVAIAFPLARGLHAALDGARVVVGDARGDVARFVSPGGQGGWRMDEMWTSNAYGRRAPAGRLLQRMPLEGELVAATLIQPAGDAPVIALQVTRDGAATVVTIERAAGAPEVLRLAQEAH